jgi:N-methylhydantoinase B
LLDLKERDVVHLNLPGGGGYGDPFQRAVQKVLWDVIEGYVSPKEAEIKYGVAVRYKGSADDWVRLPEQWMVDQERTAKLRGRSS